MVCKNGHVSLLKQLRQQKLVPSLDTFTTGDGMTCLHLATAKNKPDLVQHLLETTDLASKPDAAKSETPLFYALSKHKNA